jgi:hypothetical protein
MTAKTNVIKFSSDYPKLWGQDEAKLIYVGLVEDSGKSDIEMGFKLSEYDTKKSDGSYYPLPMGTLIQLVFLGDEGIPFCTLRRFIQRKFEYYKSKIGEWFEIKVVEE